ncbi:MAG: SGNH/GDSL hydrolase family protein [Candidatus Fermentibacteraceae bacterium]|nr:SGNH/GDSL hydrolase family protein [Candidatus Fermentibacteraceae bacterium]MBN2609395.1 SGNH/GDSL hydrolase family protein [Candidatus Fermentibacteraceae bacterium]
MSDAGLGEGSVKFLRVSALVSGIILVLVSVAADALGLSAGEGLSRNQAVIGLLGLMLTTAGVFGRKFINAYRFAGLFFLNLVVVFLLIDVLSLVILKVWAPPQMLLHTRKTLGSSLTEPVNQAGTAHYSPYVMWRALPGLTGESTDSLGHRITPGSHGIQNGCGTRIFLLGGSATWGIGVDDRETIAAHLVELLGDSIGSDLEITNLSQVGWNSTQEMIELLFELRDGNVPDIVVFMDGFNEVFTAYQSGLAGVHQNFPQTAELIENRVRQPGLTERLWYATNMSILVDLAAERGVFARPDTEEIINYSTMGLNADSLSFDIVDVCLANYSLVRILGETYGFKCIFIWQPVIWLGSKPLAPEEERIAAGTEGYEFTRDPAFKALLAATYSMFSDSVARYPDIHMITDVFDSTSSRVYTDPSGVHVDGAGNRIIANRIGYLILGVSEP